MAQRRKQSEQNEDGQPRAEAPAGWQMSAWCTAVGICRQTLYTIPTDNWPRVVRIGSRVVIIESPADWLKRMADRGGVVALRKPDRNAQEARP